MNFLPPHEYQTNCIERYLFYKAKVNILLPEARVEHIGASAIPNAYSKGDLDIFIGVGPSELGHAIQILLGLGFTEKQNTLRTHQLCMLEAVGEDAAFQVITNGSEFECFLKFRDILRLDIDLVNEYNELKMSCKGLSNSAYQVKKSLFIKQVLAKA